MIEKRRERGEYARADRLGGEMAEVSEKDLMGSNGDAEYQAMSVARKMTTTRMQVR